MRYSLPVVLSLMTLPGVAQGQACMGQTPYAKGAVKVGGAAYFGNGISAFSGTAGLGRPHGIFGGASLGFASGNGGTGTLVSGIIGKELSKPITDKLELCPIASLGLQFGPNGAYERNYILGAMVGYPLATSSTSLRVVLAGDYLGIYQQYGTNTDVMTLQQLSGGGGPYDHHEWYGLLDLGVGFIFNERFSLVPQFRIPIRYSGGLDPFFIIRGNLNIGK